MVYWSGVAAAELLLFGEMRGVPQETRIWAAHILLACLSVLVVISTFWKAERPLASRLLWILTGAPATYLLLALAPTLILAFR
jgi:hypothetical protein